MSVCILQGDCIAMMRGMEAESVDCVVTSPPYWGLRDYGVDGQMGMERTLGEHLEVMVDVFAEIHRVLKPSGSVWVNYGDCYASAPNGRSAADTKAAGTDDRTFRDKPFSTVGPIYISDPRSANRVGDNSTLQGKQHAHMNGRIHAGGYLKPKDLCMVPNRLAIELQSWGWWVRSEIIWGKPNAMPDSSGRGRPATAHEKIFLLSKSGRTTCWRAYDTGEWAFQKPDLTERLPIKRGKNPDRNRWEGFDFFYDANAVRRPPAEDTRNNKGQSRPSGWATEGEHTAIAHHRPKVNSNKKQRGHSKHHAGFNDRWDAMTRQEQQEKGGFLRNYEPAPMQVWEIPTAKFTEAHFATFPPELAERCIKAGCPEGGHVFDPFGGAGTTGLVADRLGRSCTMIELNPEYIDIARRRIERDSPMFAKVEVVA